MTAGVDASPLIRPLRVLLPGGERRLALALVISSPLGGPKDGRDKRLARKPSEAEAG